VIEHVPSDWYADFFTELPNEFWRRAVSPEATAAEVDFIQTHLGLRPRSRILDVPCGSGRHTLAMAARGHDVLGVDISQEAIDHARSTAASAGLDVELVVAEMRDIARDGSFDAAICMGNSFGYLDLDGLREFVAALAAAVRPGGGLVVDFSAAAESVLPGFVDDRPRDMTVGDITVSGSNTYDVAGSRLLSSYVFNRGGQETRVTALHHLYTVAHLRQLLAEGGFTDVEQYGGLDGEPFEVGTGRLLLTAHRADRPSAATATNAAVLYYADNGVDAERIEHTGRDGTRTMFVAVPDPSSVVEVACELADQGIHLIELCGGMGLRPARSVLEAVGGRVAVGVCTFGLEAVTAAAAFKARAERGEPLVGAFLYLEDGADPTTDRVVSEPANVRTLFVPVPDQSAAAAVASALVDNDGVEIIELYRGIGPTAAAEVIDAVGDRIPVGSVLYQGPTRPIDRRPNGPRGGFFDDEGVVPW